MGNILKIATGIILVILMLKQSEFKKFFVSEPKEEQPTLVASEDAVIAIEPDQSTGDYLVNDSLYRWDEVHLNWVSVDQKNRPAKTVLTSISDYRDNQKPVRIDWSLLMEIEYNLKYYQAFDMKIYSPVFTEALIALDGKEVIIEGFVIPLDENGDLVALSANPYASCFFCGKASPASVMSLYLKKKKLYKMDDYRKFRGTLKLNYNDPEEYYFILENAVPKR